MAIGTGNNGIWFDPSTHTGCYRPQEGPTNFPPIHPGLPTIPDIDRCKDHYSKGHHHHHHHHHKGHHHHHGKPHLCGQRQEARPGSYLETLQSYDESQRASADKLAQMGFKKTSAVGANQLESKVLNNGVINNFNDLIPKKSDLAVGTTIWERSDGQKVVVGPDGNVSPQQ